MTNAEAPRCRTCGAANGEGYYVACDDSFHERIEAVDPSALARTVIERALWRSGVTGDACARVAQAVSGAQSASDFELVFRREGCLTEIPGVTVVGLVQPPATRP
jgi:hypothetical protein